MKKRAMKLASLCLTAGILFSGSVPVYADEVRGVQAESTADPDLIGQLAFAKCEEYINIRSDADTDSEITAKIYNNGAVTIVGQVGDWYEVTSGNAKGYVKAEYFVTGDEAKELAQALAYNVATVHPEELNIRTGPGEDYGTMGVAYQSEELEVVDYSGDWMKVALGNDEYGYINAYYVSYDTYYPVAETLEEEQARLKAEQEALLAAQSQAEESWTDDQEESGETWTETDAAQSDDSWSDTDSGSSEETWTDTEAAQPEDSWSDTDNESSEETWADTESTQPEDSWSDTDGSSSGETWTETEAPETEPTWTETEAPETEPTWTETEAPETEPTWAETEAPETEPTWTETETPETEPTWTETEAPETEPTWTETEAPETEPTWTETEAPETEAASSTGQSIADYAVQFVGNPYVWGGTSLTNGADCSGFVQSVFANFGISLARTAADQSYGGTSVSFDSMQAGDLVFYGSSGIDHVALYIGGGQVVHAANSNSGIIISDCYYNTPVSARRYW